MPISTRAGAPGKRATALPPDERRAAIIDAVLPLVREHGDRITTKQIAEAAGIAEGTIFRVFADKEELFLAVHEAVLDQAPFEQAIAAIDPDQPFESRLLRAVELTQRRIVEVFTIHSQLGPVAHPKKARPMSDSPEIAKLFASAPEAIRVDPVTASRILRGLTLSMTHPMIAPRAASAEQILDVVLHGIGEGSRV